MTASGTTYLWERVPGKVIVVANAFAHGAAEVEVTFSDGRARTMTFEGGPPHTYRGPSLAEWRERFGGDEGELTDPMLRQTHRISLQPWADADPDTTSLRFDFMFVPDEPIPPGHPLYSPPPWRQRPAVE